MSQVVAGGEVSKANASSTGLNPAWRRAAAHAIVYTGWSEGADASTIAAARAGLQRDTARLRALAPESGCYFNEVRFPLSGPFCHSPAR